MTQTYLKISKDIQKLPKTSEVFQRQVTLKGLFWPNLNTIAKVETALTIPSPTLWTCITKHDLASAPFILKTEVLSFTHSLYFSHRFEFTILEIVPSKAATTHIFQSALRIWPVSVRRHEIEVFNLQALRLMPKVWQLAGILYRPGLRNLWPSPKLHVQQ